MKSAANSARIALMAALMTICAWISIPFGAQPFTMQTFAVFLAAGLLGARDAVVTVLIYMLLGAVGLPVFNGMQGGIGVLFGSTGGFMLGFIPMAAIVGFTAKKFHGRYKLLLASMVVGMAVCYACGSVWYALLYMGGSGAGIMSVLVLCVFPFVIPDAIKILLALTVIRRVGKHL